MKNKKPDYTIYENLAYLTQIGIMMVVPIAGGVYFGTWLDRRFNTGSKFLITGAILGVIVAFLELFKLVMKIVDKQVEKRQQADEAIRLNTEEKRLQFQSEREAAKISEEQTEKEKNESD